MPYSSGLPKGPIRPPHTPTSTPQPLLQWSNSLVFGGFCPATNQGRWGDLSTLSTSEQNDLLLHEGKLGAAVQGSPASVVLARFEAARGTVRSSFSGPPLRGETWGHDVLGGAVPVRFVSLDGRAFWMAELSAVTLVGGGGGHCGVPLKNRLLRGEVPFV